MLTLISSVVILSACQKDVEKERVEAAGAWAIAVCDCEKKGGAAAKTCADALKKPADPSAETGLGSAPKYRIESLKEYISIISPGEVCETNIRIHAEKP